MPDRPQRACVLRQAGFTLIELLVVVAVIGVLVAIALPTFLERTDQASDADAKANARFLVGSVEACNAEHEDYTSCDSSAELDLEDVIWGGAGGQVSVTGATEKAYTVVAVSEVTSGSPPQPHRFTIQRDVSGARATTCTVAGRGGCAAGGSW